VAKVSLGAILAGVIVDFVLSALVMVVVVLLWGFVVAEQGKSPATNPAAFAGDTRVLLISLAVGFGTLILGGFVAGRIARHDHLLHGVLVGTISLAVGLVLGSAGSPAWFRAIVIALDIPMAALGGLLARPARPALDGKATTGA